MTGQSGSKLFANVLVVALAVLPVAAQQAVNPRGAMVKAFLDRVNAYLEVHREAAERLPQLGPTEDPSKLTEHRSALAARIRLARPQAKPGDIFGDAAPLFRDAVRRDAATRKPADTSAVKRDVPRQNAPAVNASYPEHEAVATVPPRLLNQLPPLPDGLEYRFLGTDLIIRDRHANLIADVLDEGAAPLTHK